MSCGLDGEETRTRTCTESQFGGQDCDGEAEETRECQQAPPPCPGRLPGLHPLAKKIL